MSSKKVQSIHVLHFILIVCCFKIGLYQALSTTDGTTNHIKLNVLTISAASMSSSTENMNCENLEYVHNIGNKAYYNWYVGFNDWYNSTFWGGHVQIPWKGSLDKGCSKWPNSTLAMLNEKHVDIAEIGEDVITMKACILNHTDECISNFTVEMRTCNGHLLYRFVRDYDSNIHYSTYICFERIPHLKMSQSG
ncbi:uncharacterized protein LOC132728090 [Ruditapes philippinarum]|uniref:uncharacterized protein LOC132728090 n=1 Tax=Ruditapes philippinarum TaxID=129788 RepID=UPI00295AC837|nr:uncharacterized protein LOC132728090 [Ruditapes philippinarum]